jgi:hypothetical protein
MNPHPQSPRPPSLRLREYSLGAAAITTGAFALAPQEAGAAIVQFSDSGSYYQGTHWPNGDQAQIDINLGDSTTLRLDWGGAPDYLNFDLMNGGGWDASGPGGYLDYYYTPRILSKGDAIHPIPSVAGYSTAAYGVTAGVPELGWDVAFTDKYLGFRTGAGNEGYLKVSWDPSTGLFSYNGGAIENTGADLLAGQSPSGGGGSVPEPGILALLAAGAVGLARRRQAMKLAA